MSTNGNGNDGHANGADRTNGHSNGGGPSSPAGANGSNALTPFEFALAGVAPPTAQSAGSFRVIQDMRALVDGTSDAPITHAGLQDFLDSGGRLSLGGERRRRLPKSTATTNSAPGRIGGTGAFIDITPPDMVQPDPVSEAVPAATAALASITPSALDPAAEPEPEPELEATPTEAVADETPREPESDPGDRSIDAVQADLQALLSASGAAPVEPTDPPIDDHHDESVPPYLVGDLVTGPVAGLTADPEPAAHSGPDPAETADEMPLEVEPVAAVSEMSDVADASIAIDADGLATNELDASDLDAAGVVDLTAAADEPGDTSGDGPVALELTEPEQGPAVLGSTTDGLRGDDGRFGPAEQAERDRSAIIAAAVAAAIAGGAAGLDGERDGDATGDADTTTSRPASVGADAGPATPLAVADILAGPDAAGASVDSNADMDTPDQPAGKPIAVGAAGAGTLGLLEPAGAEAPPMVASPSMPVLATVSRRPGGTLLALVGAGAAAVVLLAGTLWWTNSATSTSTDAEPTDAETAAAPSTTESGTLAGSLSGPAERSTGDDDEPAEFQADDDPTPSTLTVTSTPSGSASGQTSTSTSTSTSSSTTAGVGSTSAPAVATSTPPSTTPPSTASPDSTEAPTSTAPPSTSPPPPPTTQRPVVTASVVPRLAYIGDRVTIDNYNGPPLANVRVSLYVDDNRDGRGDRLVANRTTDSNGRYSFDQVAGCYEVRFTAPNGYEIRPDLSRQALCLESGGSNARVDAIAEPVVAAVAPPRSCVVEQAGNFAGLGVEISENGNNWAESYTFYTRGGSVVARTRNLGPYDTDPGEDDREWFGAENGFNHRDVWSVAAERGGIESARITCSRL